MAQLTYQQIQTLMTEPGREALAAALDSGDEIGPAQVARLRAAWPAEIVSAALVLAGLRRRAAERFSRADAMWFDGPDLLEQATSEPVGLHKAERFAGLDRVADVCCGAGGDAVQIARRVGRLVGIDISPGRLLCLRGNAEAYEVAERVGCVAADVGQWVVPAEAYHVDPPRRDAGKRHLSAENWQEWVALVRDLAARKTHVAGKLSPAIDPAILDWADEVEFIGENGTLKQAVAWCGQLARARRSATVIRSRQGRTAASEAITGDQPRRTAEPAGPLEPGQILHEPDPAVVRAGLLGNLADRLGAGQVDPHLPLLVSAQVPQPTLLARYYEVLEWMPWSVKKVRQLLRQRGWQAREVKTRAFAARPEELLAGLKQAKSPPDASAVVLWAVRLQDKPMAILSRRLAGVVAEGETQG